jgi:hypothetical protein
LGLNRIFRTGPPKNENFSDVLHSCTKQFIGYLRKHLFTFGALSSKDPHFNQSMRGQCNIDLFQDSRRGTALSNMNGHIEIMRQAFQRTSLNRI